MFSYRFGVVLTYNALMCYLYNDNTCVDAEAFDLLARAMVCGNVKEQKYVGTNLELTCYPQTKMTPHYYMFI